MTYPDAEGREVLRQNEVTALRTQLDEAVQLLTDLGCSAADASSGCPRCAFLATINKEPTP